MYHGGWSQANAVQNTWYNISDADFVSLPLNGVTHDGSGKLTVTEPGMYLVKWSLDWQNNTVNDHIETGIEISGAGTVDTAKGGVICSETKFANEEDTVTSFTILDLADNATLEIAVRTTDNNTPTISVDCATLACLQIGGT